MRTQGIWTCYRPADAQSHTWAPSQTSDAAADLTTRSVTPITSSGSLLPSSRSPTKLHGVSKLCWVVGGRHALAAYSVNTTFMTAATDVGAPLRLLSGLDWG